ncbi:50S ribosomal protein L6 [Candidatus Margulisiibacteriota bacterium]
MSRIGKKPISIPEKVTVSVEGNTVAMKGPKGELKRMLPDGISAAVKDGILEVARKNDNDEHRALHGLMRALLANALQGVHEGFEKVLDVVGVGYRFAKKGKGIELQLGYSHPISYDPPEGIELTVDGQTKIIVRGIDREKVGQVAAELRAFRKPEPYKGKGMRYSGEHITRKAGKAAAKVGGAA